MAKKIAFISALGGQGTSLSVYCAARAAAMSGRPIALVDTCGFGGTLSYISGAGEGAVMNLNDAASGECLPEEALIGCGENFWLLPAGSFSERNLSPLSVEVRRVIESLAREYDVFADVPSGILPDCGMVGSFDLFVICCRADAMSLKYSAMLCRLIRKAAAQTTGSCDIRLLLTDFSPEGMRLGGVRDIDQCIDTVGARLTGVLPHDSRAMEASLSGQPPDERCEIVRCAKDTAERLFGGRVPLDSGRSFRLPL